MSSFVHVDIIIGVIKDSSSLLGRGVKVNYFMMICGCVFKLISCSQSDMVALLAYIAQTQKCELCISD